MAELDGMRAVYHTNFIKWFDLARTKLFREAGVQMEKWEEGGILLPLVVCHCEYAEGARFDDPVKAIEMWFKFQKKNPHYLNKVLLE